MRKITDAIMFNVQTYFEEIQRIELLDSRETRLRKAATWAHMLHYISTIVGIDGTESLSELRQIIDSLEPTPDTKDIPF